MSIKFKDYFSKGSKDYCQYRPRYPENLFSYLSSLTPYHDSAWDCATGNGQSAINLSNHYSEVIGTDASKNQIDCALKKKGVIYQVEKAENSTFDNESMDIITVAQALHWFNIDAFSFEVNRVLRNKGILAIWGYCLLNINSEINDVINHLYIDVLGPFWCPERKMVENGYKDVNFPFEQLISPVIKMKTEWNLSQLIGYLGTWSAAHNYQIEHGMNPVKDIYKPLSDLWGDPKQILTVEWPLAVKVWLKKP